MFNSQSIAIFFKGVAMGISDLIPGISGGTIALLLGIYKNFIDSLKSINHKSLIYLAKYIGCFSIFIRVVFLIGVGGSSHL